MLIHSVVKHTFSKTPGFTFKNCSRAKLSQAITKSKQLVRDEKLYHPSLKCSKTVVYNVSKEGYPISAVFRNSSCKHFVNVMGSRVRKLNVYYLAHLMQQFTGQSDYHGCDKTALQFPAQPFGLDKMGAPTGNASLFPFRLLWEIANVFCCTDAAF